MVQKKKKLDLASSIFLILSIASYHDLHPLERVMIDAILREKRRTTHDKVAPTHAADC